MAKYKEHIEQELFERIEAYILNTMDIAARLDFEKEMSADESLGNEVALQQKMIASVEVCSYYNKEKKETELPYNAPPLKKITRIWWYAAATVLTILVTWFYKYNASSTKEIYAGYFMPDDGLPVVMSGTNANYDFYNGMISYKEGNYSEAIDIWEPIKYNSDTLQYYTGIAYLNDNKDKQAIELLLPLAENKSTPWQSKAIWYLTWAYLKQNNKTEAIVWLKKLTDNEQAALLLKDIQKSSP